MALHSWTCHSSIAAMALAILAPTIHGAFVVFEGSDTAVTDFTAGADVGSILGNGNTLDIMTGANALVVQGDGNTITEGADGSKVTILGNDNTFTGDNTTPNQSSGDEIIVIGNENDINAGRGNDLIHVLGNDNEIRGNRGEDRIQVTGNNNLVRAGRNDDVIVVSNGMNNNVQGRNGVDVLTFAGPGTTLKGDQQIDTFVPAYKSFDDNSMDSATITDFQSTEVIDFSEFECAGSNMYNLGLVDNSNGNDLDIVVYTSGGAGMYAMYGVMMPCFSSTVVTIEGVTAMDVSDGTTVVNIVNPVGSCLMDPVGVNPMLPVCI
uniref:Uncharacterized protein n=1 Tax=Entomoneis paludosa TaxID=265537 RepID=A0A7S2YQ61_9STRA